MGNLTTSLQRFFANKNTVTILGVIAGVLVLGGFYNWRVKKATSPKSVPYAKKVLVAKTEITSDVIGYTDINSKFLKTAKIITNPSSLIGKYVNVGTSIPAGGLFYTDQVVEKDSLPDTVFDNIPKGATIYTLTVNNHTTYGNSIYPGTKIDLYMKTNDDATKKLMYGKLIQGIEVLAVRDSSGKDVFDQNPPSTPAELLFAVNDEMYNILMKATYLSGVTIVPVPRNKAYTADTGSTQYGSEELKNYIIAKTITLSDENVNNIQPDENTTTE